MRLMIVCALLRAYSPQQSTPGFTLCCLSQRVPGPDMAVRLAAEHL